MAQIDLLNSRISQEGARRLLAGLEEAINSGRDLGPRGAQIQALGLSLEQTSQELKQQLKRISIESNTEQIVESVVGSEFRRWIDDLMDLANAFARLGAAVRSYPGCAP